MLCDTLEITDSKTIKSRIIKYVEYKVQRFRQKSRKYNQYT